MDLLIGFVVGLIVLAIVLWIVYAAINAIPFPPPLVWLRTVILLLVALVAVLVLAGWLGVLPERFR